MLAYCHDRPAGRSVRPGHAEDQRLVSHNHPWPFAHLCYDPAGHTIAPPYIPTTEGSFSHPITREVLALGGTTEGRAHANEDWWQKRWPF